MTRAGKVGEFLSCERMFVCQLKLAGNKIPTIWEKFVKKIGKMAPCWSAKKAMAKKWDHESHGKKTLYLRIEQVTVIFVSQVGWNLKFE